LQKYQEVIKLTRKFDIKATKASRIIPGVYKITLDNDNQYALKSMRYPVSQLIWIDKTLQKVRKNGFPKISWRRPHINEEKKLFAKLDKTYYVLNPWIDGHWPSPKSKADMLKCGITLAKFHQVGHAINIPKKGAVNMLFKWSSELNSIHQILETHITKAKQNKYKSELDSILQEHGEKLLNYSLKAQQILRNSDYLLACNNALKNKPLCHGDGGPTNFIFNKNGAHLIDFETLRIDLRSYDLYRIIYNSSKDHAWDFQIAKSILEGYQSIFKLNHTDFELMKVWLRFPRTTNLALNKHNRSKQQGKAIYVNKIPAALLSEEQVTLFLQKLDNYAGNAIKPIYN